MGFDWSFGLGDVVSSLTDLGSTMLQGYYARNAAEDQVNASSRLMQEQAAINEKFYKKRYQMTANDMEKAGLNPILAASGGFSVGNAPSVGLPSASMAVTPSVPTLSSSVKAFSEAEKAQSDAQRSIKEAQLAGNRSKESLENAVRIRAEAGKIKQEENETVQRIYKLQREIDQISANIGKIGTEKDFMASRMSVNAEEAKRTSESRILMKQQREQIVQAMEKLAYELNELRRISDYYGSSVGAYMAYLRETGKAVAPFLGPASRTFGR